MKTKEEILRFLQRKNYQKHIDKLSKKYKNKKIAIYGAGIIFQTIKEHYDLSCLNIVGIADMKFNSSSDSFMGYKACTPYEFISELAPDIVLVGMINMEIADDFFKDELFEKFGKFKYEPLLNINLFDVISHLLRKENTP